MKVTFLGSGAWASALAHTLAQKESHDIILYGNNPAEIENINTLHRNMKYFPDILLPDCIKGTTDPKLALSGRDILVLAVPSSQIGNIIALVKEHCDTTPILINVIKGFNPNNGEGITSMIRRELGGDERVKGVVSLVGPSFAHDVIHGDITAIAAVSDSEECAKTVQVLFSSPSFRVYYQHDVIGAEIGAGMKNIIAIASGMLEGLGYRENARAALITRGLAEIVRFGLARGAEKDTFFGLTGIGDLYLTCSSMRSRNYAFGHDVGRLDEAAPVLEKNQKTVEGVLAAKTIHLLAKNIGVETPIVDQVYAVLYEGKKPSVVARELMGRSLKKE